MARLTDQAGNLDTSGVGAGPHGKLGGVSPVFDVAEEASGMKPKRDMTLGERLKEKAVAASGSTADDPTRPYRTNAHQAGAIDSQNPDFADEGMADPHTDAGADQTATWDTETLSGISTPTGFPEGVQGRSPAAPAPAAEAEADEPQGEPQDATEALSKLTVAKLVKLAPEGLGIKASMKKEEIVAALVAAGVEAP